MGIQQPPPPRPRIRPAPRPIRRSDLDGRGGPVAAADPNGVTRSRPGAGRLGTVGCSAVRRSAAPVQAGEVPPPHAHRARHAVHRLAGPPRQAAAGRRGAPGEPPGPASPGFARSLPRSAGGLVRLGTSRLPAAWAPWPRPRSRRSPGGRTRRGTGRPGGRRTPVSTVRGAVGRVEFEMTFPIATTGDHGPPPPHPIASEAPPMSPPAAIPRTRTKEPIHGSTTRGP